MLVTEERHELSTFSFLQGVGNKMWSVVSFELNIPYFFFSYEILDNGIWIHQASILWQEDQVTHFCQDIQCDSSKKITQIAMLLPPSKNVTDAWGMFTLKEIWTGRVRDSPQRAMVFVGIDGERLLNTSTYDESQIELLEQVYLLAPTPPILPNSTNPTQDL